MTSVGGLLCPIEIRLRRPRPSTCDVSHTPALVSVSVPNEMLDAYETGSALEAGADAGAYLQRIGKTDIATLDAGEWREFLRRLFVGYELALRRKILNNESPF